MTDYSGNALGIDTSRYTTKLDWVAMKAAQVSFVWAKCSEGVDWIDPRFQATVDEGAAADIPVLAFHFFDTSYLCAGAFGEEHWPPFNVDKADLTDPNQDKQLLNMKKALRFKTFYGIGLDLERWWLDYNDYYINGSNAKKVTSVWISTVFERFADAVRKTWSDKQVYIYSRASFIKEFCPQMYQTGWFKNNNYPLWTAEYYQPKTVTQTNFAEIRQKYLPNGKVPADWGDGSMTNNPWVWQFTGDKLTIPGFMDGANLSALDVNICKQTQKEFWNFIGFTPKGATIPIDPPPINDPNIPPTTTTDLTPVMTKLEAMDAKLDLIAINTDKVAGLYK
jgi:hypothetical protein